MTSVDRQFLLAGEGGGTRLSLWLIPSRGGDPVASHVAGPANVNTLGVDGFVDSFEEASVTLITRAGVRREEVTSVTLALAGIASPAAGAPVVAALRARGFGPAVAIDNDASVTLRGATRGGPGALLIAGTGSIAWARDAAGGAARCGGWGPAAGDDGSGHDLGRRALRRLARHLDGRGRDEALMPRFVAFLAGEAERDPATWIRRHASAPDRMASLAPLIVDAAAEGDPASARDLDEAAAALVELALTVIRSAGLDAAAPLFLHGSLLTRVDRYRERVVAGIPDRPVSRTPPDALLTGLRLQLPG